MKPCNSVYPPDAPLAGNGGQRLAQPDDAPDDAPPARTGYPLRLPVIIGVGCFVLLVTMPQPSSTVAPLAHGAEIVLGSVWALLAWAVVAAIRNRRT